MVSGVWGCSRGTMGVGVLLQIVQVHWPLHFCTLHSAAGFIFNQFNIETSDELRMWNESRDDSNFDI